MRRTSETPARGDAAAVVAGAEAGRSAPLRTPVHRREGGRRPYQAVDEEVTLRALQEWYPLGRWRAWQRAERGKSNSTWFVETDAGGVVLRRSHELKTVAGAEFECGLIDHLLAAGYPAPPVVRTRDGDQAVELDGVVHMVMRRLPGRAYDGADAADLRVVARGLGRYHAIVAALAADDAARSPSALRALGSLGRQRLRWALDVVAPLLAPDRAAAARRDARHLAHEMAVLERGLGPHHHELTWSLTHGSYGPSAVLLTGDRLTGVLDFDRAAHDLLTLDLAYSLRAFCRLRPARDTQGLDPRLCEEFLRSYRREAPLAQPDLRALPSVLRAQRLIKVVRKCDNLLTKHSLAPQRAKDAAKFAVMLERERARLRWLDEHPLHFAEDA
jgi:homoserine kinase type II